MVRATAVFLVVHSFAAAAFSADKGLMDRCECPASGDFVVAFKPLVSNLGNQSDGRNSVTGQQAAPQFHWKPRATEKKWIYVIVHHSATDSGSVESIHTEHRQRKDSLGNPWLGIGYHFVIGNGAGMKDGEVQPTFRWSQQIHGAHSGSTVHNANGIGICLIGNFQQHNPTRKQLTAVTDLIGRLSQRYEIPARLVIGHNTVKPTACPGKKFPLQDVVRNSVSERNQGSEFSIPNRMSFP